MNGNDTQRDLGRLEARMDSVETALKGLSIDMKSVNATLNQAKGGWRTLMLVIGISATVGALVAKFSGLVLK